MPTPEDKAREQIDLVLEKSSWKVKDTNSSDLNAARGISLRNLPLVTAQESANYLLCVDRKAAGMFKAKKAGVRFAAVEAQAAIREQHQIVCEVEHRLSVIEKLEALIEANPTHTDRLRQSTSHQAFSGQLAWLQRSVAPVSLIGRKSAGWVRRQIDDLDRRRENSNAT